MKPAVILPSVILLVLRVSICASITNRGPSIVDHEKHPLNNPHRTLPIQTSAPTAAPTNLTVSTQVVNPQWRIVDYKALQPYLINYYRRLPSGGRPLPSVAPFQHPVYLIPAPPQADLQLGQGRSVTWVWPWIRDSAQNPPKTERAEASGNAVPTFRSESTVPSPAKSEGSARRQRQNFKPPQTGPLSENQELYELARSNAAFAFDLYEAVAAQQSSGGNVVISPFSISCAIAALTEGAGGTTASQIYRALHRSMLNADSAREQTREIMRQLSLVAPRQFYMLSVASRLFVQDGYTLNATYQNTLGRYYLTDAQIVDFGYPDTAEQIINNWAAQVTFHKIPTLISPGTLDIQTRLVVANAVYFKGDWVTMFDEKNTKPRPFYTGIRGSKQIMVPMMSVQANFPYADMDTLGFQLLELPYRGRDVSMVLALPYEETSDMARMQRTLSRRPYLITDMEKYLRNTSITVVIPKFRVESSTNIKKALLELGIRELFEQGKADLSGITDGGNKELYVSDAVHQAALEVTEKGSRAAAATAMVVKGRAMSFDPVFRADHPFMFFIRHNPTSSILFMGHVNTLKDVGDPDESVTSTPSPRRGKANRRKERRPANRSASA